MPVDQICDALTERPAAQLDDDADVDDIRARLASGPDAAWLRDRRGAEFAVRASAVAWVEVAPSD